MMLKGFRGSIWLTFQSPGKILELARKGEAWGHPREPAGSRTRYCDWAR
jgi:hypothetical protein